MSFEFFFLPAHVTAVHGLRERCHGRLKTVELQVLKVCLHVTMHPCFHSGTDKIVVTHATFSPFQKKKCVHNLKVRCMIFSCSTFGRGTRTRSWLPAPTTGWHRPIGCLQLQLIFRERATNYRALLRKLIFTDMASYGSSPPCSTQSNLKVRCMVVSCSTFSAVAQDRDCPRHP